MRLQVRYAWGGNEAEVEYAAMAHPVSFPKQGIELEERKRAIKEKRAHEEAKERRARARQDMISTLMIAGSFLLGIKLAKLR